MGSAAVKMGVIAGPPIESPDVMYDLKERVHRTPHVRGSAVPSPTRLNINQEEDLMLLSNGTVVRIQVCFVYFLLFYFKKLRFEIYIYLLSCLT